MKMTQEDFNTLKGFIQPLHTQERYQEYKSKGLTDMRYRWDLLWSSKPNWPNIHWLVDTFKELNDSHIDTALRKITNTK